MSWVVILLPKRRLIFNLEGGEKMNKYEKICKKEGHHCWDLEEIDVIDEDFDNVELEITCDRCGASASLVGNFGGARKNWKPLREAYWERRDKERKEDEELMMREDEKRKKE